MLGSGRRLSIYLSLLSSRPGHRVASRMASRMASLLTYGDKVAAIERAVQGDPGHRGIADFTPPAGELQNAAEALYGAATATTATGADVLVVTGFPCLLEFSPPTETDGPLGAVAIARALLS